MNDTGRYRELSMTQAELDGLPPYSPELRYGDPEGFYRDQSTADGSPMVMRFADHPLGMREVWYAVEVSR